VRALALVSAAAVWASLALLALRALGGGAALPAALARAAAAAPGALLAGVVGAQVAGALSASGALEVLLVDRGRRAVLFSKLAEGRAPAREDVERALAARPRAPSPPSTPAQ